MIILRDIMFYNQVRFSDFATAERISTNILADRLSKLEDFGLIDKKINSNLKNQFTYSVPEKGKTLLPMLIEMTLWGLEHDPQSLASKEFIERIQTEKQKVIHEITRSIESDKFTDYRIRQMGINPK